MESRKNHIVHVHPNGASPIRWVMLCVTFHIERAAQREMTLSRRDSEMILYSIINNPFSFDRGIQYPDHKLQCQ